MNYRREIDGLRAIAVLVVIFFHAGFPQFHGGFIGVDVFFVISGYLITSLILKDVEIGTFNFWKFYERRARRILPALIAVMTFTFPLAWMWMMPIEMKTYSASIFSVLLFSSNIYFWRVSDYFDTSAELKPLLHTWSLSVEEQYYILFPIALIVLLKFGKKKSILFLIVSASLSLIFSEISSRYYPSFNFYWLSSRAWELLSGAICAFALIKPCVSRDNFLSLSGLLAIALPVFFYDETIRFPSIYALVPVAGTCAILLFARQGTYAATILSWKPLVLIGLISYSAYLWHHPVFALTRLQFSEFDLPIKAALILLSFLLAGITWKFIEQPFRNSAHPALKKRSNFLKICALTIAILLLFTAFGYFYKGTFGRLTNEQLQIVVTANNSPKRQLCHTEKGVDKIPPEESCIYFGTNPSVAVYGNSHGVELAYGLANILHEQSKSIIHFTISGCEPSFKRKTLDHCDQFFESRLNYILEHEEIRNIVLAFRTDIFGSEATNSLINLANMLNRSNKNVVLVIQAPILKLNVFQYIRALFRTGQHSVSSLTRGEWGEMNKEFYSALDRLDKGVQIIDLANIFCDENKCYAVKNGVAMYFDNNHMSVSAANIVARQMTLLLK